MWRVNRMVEQRAGTEHWQLMIKLEKQQEELTYNKEEEELKEIFEDNLSVEKWEKFEDWLEKAGQVKIIKKIIEQAYNKKHTIRETITEVV